MTNVPSYSSTPQAPTRLSGACVTSLVLGLLFCIPLVASVAAIIFAAVGLRVTRNTMIRGRGLATAGLVLGIIGVVMWGCVGAFVALLIGGSTAPRATLHDFAGNLAAGNIPAATAECTSAITPGDITTLHTRIVLYGTYTDLTCLGVKLYSGTTGATCNLSGSMKFSGGTHLFNAELIKDTGGDWKIESFFIH